MTLKPALVAALALALNATNAAASAYGLVFHSDANAQTLGLPPGTGIVVALVLPGSPAEAAGLHAFDVVRVIAGRPTTDAEVVSAGLNATPPFVPLIVRVACPHSVTERDAVLVGLMGPPQLVTYVRLPPLAGPAPHRAVPSPAAPAATGDVIQDAMHWNNSVVAKAAQVADDAIRSMDRDGRCRAYSTSDVRYTQCIQSAYGHEDLNLRVGQAWSGRAQRLSETIDHGLELMRQCSRGVPGACADSDRHTARLWAQVRLDERAAAGFSGLAASGRIGNSIARMEAARSEADYTRSAAGLAEGYAEWAADATRAGRADLAASYADQARHWHAMARR